MKINVTVLICIFLGLFGLMGCEFFTSSSGGGSELSFELPEKLLESTDSIIVSVDYDGVVDTIYKGPVKTSGTYTWNIKSINTKDSAKFEVTEFKGDGKLTRRKLHVFGFKSESELEYLYSVVLFPLATKIITIESKFSKVDSVQVELMGKGTSTELDEGTEFQDSLLLEDVYQAGDTIKIKVTQLVKGEVFTQTVYTLLLKPVGYAILETTILVGPPVVMPIPEKNKIGTDSGRVLLIRADKGDSNLQDTTSLLDSTLLGDSVSLPNNVVVGDTFTLEVAQWGWEFLVSQTQYTFLLDSAGPVLLTTDYLYPREGQVPLIGAVRRLNDTNSTFGSLSSFFYTKQKLDSVLVYNGETVLKSGRVPSVVLKYEYGSNKRTVRRQHANGEGGDSVFTYDSKNRLLDFVWRDSSTEIRDSLVYNSKGFHIETYNRVDDSLRTYVKHNWDFSKNLLMSDSVYQYGDSSFVSGINYQYDGSDKLKELVVSKARGGVSQEITSEVYQYDGKGRLNRVEHYELGGQKVLVGQDDYDYNRTGQAVRVLLIEEDVLMNVIYNSYLYVDALASLKKASFTFKPQQRNYFERRADWGLELINEGQKQ